MKIRFPFNYWLWMAGVLGVSCLSGHAAKDGQGLLVGSQAPAFHVQGIYEENYSLEAFKGHILVMQFGTSW